MTASRHIVRQRDFSGGEIVEHAKRRDDEAAVRAGARTLRNVRILASGAVEQRPGRSALYSHEGRSEEIRLDSETTIFLCFGNDGSLKVRNSSSVLVAQAWGYEWDADTVHQAVWALYNKDIVITFDGQAPKIVRWDGATGFTFLDWEATETSAGRKLVPFVRFAPPNVTMALSALTGSVTVTFSDDVLDASHVGVRFRYYDKQLEFTAVTSATVGTATIKENLRQISSFDFTSDVTDQFAVGDIIESDVSGAVRYVTEVGTPGVDDITVIRLNAVIAAPGEIYVGPTGSAEVSSSNADPTSGAAITVWDEELMSEFRGWPRSVSVDQNRLIFSDFPGMPEAIAWSALGDHTDFATGLADDADPTDAICEFAPKKARVFHVMDGADEFVFTDLGIYYIPISESNPLRPGSVAFRRIPGAKASSVRPVSTAQGIVYANNAGNRVLAIVGTGQTAQPYLIRPASDLQSHLFDGITCLAVEEGGGDPPDEFVYAVKSDGDVVLGRYQPGKDWPGWVLWTGDGDVRWISVANGAAVFSTEYAAGWLTERIDADAYLDGQVSYDAIPAALGTGAQSDILMPDDQGTAGGSMTAAGGIAAVRNGVTAQSAATAASKTSSTDSFWFVRFGQPMLIKKLEIWPSNDSGFASVTPVTVSARGVTGSTDPTLGSEGASIGTTGSIADTTAMQTITSSDQTTEFTYLIVRIQSASGNHFLGEVRIYSPVASHGTGELWFLPDTSVDAMDGRRVVGTATVDGDGEVTLSAETLDDQQLGFGFDVTIEPFIPHVGPGQAIGQTMTKRQISELAVAVQNSTGFKVQVYREASGAWVTRNTRGAFNEGETTSGEPTAREEVYIAKPEGNEIDPRIRILKDYPGPLRVLEISDNVGA